MGTLCRERNCKVKRKRYPRKFQRMAVERMRSCEDVGELAKELGVTPTMSLQMADPNSICSNLGRSRRGRARMKGPTASKSDQSEATSGGENAGGGFFQRCLAKNRGSTPEERRFWRDGIYEQIRELMPLQGGLSIERMCELARVSRASFYRSLKEQRPAEEETEVRSTIQQIALEHRRRYGYRRICAELRRRGMQVNHKRVLRMMRKDNLLALRRRRFVVTTNSNHKFEVYLNLSPSHEAEWDGSALGSRHHLHSVEGRVRLSGGDSRCLFSESGGLGAGSNAGEPADDCGTGAGDCATTAATWFGSPLRPRTAIRSWRICGVLEKYGIVPSMSRPANPYDNASCESFMKTLKREEIYANRYDNLEHLRSKHRRVHRAVLQSTAIALGAGLPIP